MATSPAAPSGDAASVGTSDEQAAPQLEEQPVSKQMTASEGVPADRPSAEEWKPPGDWRKGFYPGDPNTYQDPDNPIRSY